MGARGRPAEWGPPPALGRAAARRPPHRRARPPCLAPRRLHPPPPALARGRPPRAVTGPVVAADQRADPARRRGLADRRRIRPPRADRAEWALWQERVGA